MHVLEWFGIFNVHDTTIVDILTFIILTIKIIIIILVECQFGGYKGKLSIYSVVNFNVKFQKLCHCWTCFVADFIYVILYLFISLNASIACHKHVCDSVGLMENIGVVMAVTTLDGVKSKCINNFNFSITTKSILCFVTYRADARLQT